MVDANECSIFEASLGKKITQAGQGNKSSEEASKAYS